MTPGMDSQKKKAAKIDTISLPFPYVMREETMEELMQEGERRERAKQENNSSTSQISPKQEPSSPTSFTWETCSSPEPSTTQVTIDGPIIFVDETVDTGRSISGDTGFIKFLGRTRRRTSKPTDTYDVFELRLNK
jgi:hypothetical protein